MNILVLGSGGREHAIAWKLSQSHNVEKIFIAPGNAGTALVGENISVLPTDFQAVRDIVISKKIDMVVVGPEQPLVNGVVDFFKNDDKLKNVRVIGPDKKGAQLEGSKAFAKDFMQRNGIPTASCFTVTSANIDEGIRHLETMNAPYVLKADGLAAGKGVLIIDDLQEAQNELRNMLSGKFGDASATVVIETFLKGIEVSMFVLTDGKHYVILPEAKDYKRIGDGDKGLNTGGMGAVSPVPFVNTDFTKKVRERIIEPTLKGLEKENITYKGFLFLGLMNVNGNPYVIEYNVRMGDPETESVMTRIDADFALMLEACADSCLDKVAYRTSPKTAVTVMMVSGGYPEHYEKGKIINGLNHLNNVFVAHAGTKFDQDGNIVTSGGRVIAVTAHGDSINEARDKAYNEIEKINFDGAAFRHDIGLDLINI